MDETTIKAAQILTSDLALTDREQKECAFALLYADHFNHGTQGHNSYLLIAKLTKIIIELFGKIKDLEYTKEQE